MRILFFGSTGNCGKHIALKLLAEGLEVHGVGRSKKNIEHENYTFYQGDICDLDFFDSLPIDVDCVINFAGLQPSILEISEKTNLSKTLESYLQVNIKGVFNILEFTRRCNIKKYIYTTSHRDYENHWAGTTQLKNDLPVAINYNGDHVMYAISKTSAKMMGDYYSNAFGISVFNFRLPMMFMVPDCPYYLSDGQKKMMPFLLLIRKAIAGETLEIWGDPQLRRDYVHVDNLWFLLNACLKSPLSGGTFNVGTGEGVTTERFVREIKNVFDTKNVCRILHRPEKHTYKCAVYDVQEEANIFGYRPILLTEMLQKLQKDINDREMIKFWGW